MNRRNLIRIGAALIPAGMLTSRATAAELQPLMLDDPIAIALGYVEDGSLVDTARYPKKAGPDGAEQHCANCALYKAVDGEAGSCAAIPGKLVKGDGWCSAWVPVS